MSGASEAYLYAFDLDHNTASQHKHHVTPFLLKHSEFYRSHHPEQAAAIADSKRSSMSSEASADLQDRLNENVKIGEKPVSHANMPFASGRTGPFYGGNAGI